MPRLRTPSVRRPPRGHCVARVHREIEQHLVELGHISNDRAHLATRHHRDFDFPGESRLDQFRHFLHEVAEGHSHALAIASVRERQYLSHDARTTPRRLANQIEPGERCGAHAVRLQQLRSQQDRRQHVVEIMRDAAGEQPDALQFLRADELFFQQALDRDVVLHRHEVRDVTPLASHRRDDHVLLIERAVLAPVVQVALPDLARMIYPNESSATSARKIRVDADRN